MASKLTNENKINQAIDSFNRRAAPIIEGFEGRGDISRDFSYSRRGKSSFENLVTSFTVPHFDSPNKIQIQLSIGFTGMIKDTKQYGSCQEIPPIESIRRGVMLKKEKHPGAYEGALIVSEDFSRDLVFSAPFTTYDFQEKRVLYVSRPVRIGDMPRGFLDVFQEDLDRLAFADNVTLTNTMDLAFRMYHRKRV